MKFVLKRMFIGLTMICVLGGLLSLGYSSGEDDSSAQLIQMPNNVRNTG